MKLPTKEAAQLFADGYTKGHDEGLNSSAKAIAKLNRRLAYRAHRVQILAQWRRDAIDRLGLGPLLIAEIDKRVKLRR